MNYTHDDIHRMIDEEYDPDLIIAERMPDRTRSVSALKAAQVVMFPQFFSYLEMTADECLEALAGWLKEEISVSLHVLKDHTRDPEELTEQFLLRLPKIKSLLLTDIQAIYDGDPAAKTKGEIIICYPGFYAISIYRIAHELYQLNVPFIPRIMTEYAHEKTGIDINPGASIGHHFCIDHGTGIVVGETAVLGDHVKLYQGVTIGAKSFELDENGNPVKGGKRHPDIGNHVVIYANATILGGTTKIGDNCVIGGNVWLTHSVPEGETVYYRSSEQ